MVQESRHGYKEVQVSVEDAPMYIYMISNGVQSRPMLVEEPPKKRREVPATEKIGIARQYLTDVGGSVLKNRHVLLYYLENQRSVLKTNKLCKGNIG